MPEITPTPDNTPLPGGGSWHWDDTSKSWVEDTPELAEERALINQIEAEEAAAAASQAAGATTQEG